MGQNGTLYNNRCSAFGIKVNQAVVCRTPLQEHVWHVPAGIKQSWFTQIKHNRCETCAQDCLLSHSRVDTRIRNNGSQYTESPRPVSVYFRPIYNQSSECDFYNVNLSWISRFTLPHFPLFLLFNIPIFQLNHHHQIQTLIVTVSFFVINICISFHL